MTIGEIESEALRLNPSDRARLAERLLDSLESLSEEENGTTAYLRPRACSLVESNAGFPAAAS